MQLTPKVLPAIAAVLIAAACSTPGGPPRTTAEREAVMDDFLSTSPMASGGIPPADQGAISP
jgi:hypothetical protein